MPSPRRRASVAPLPLAGLVLLAAIAGCMQQPTETAALTAREAVAVFVSSGAVPAAPLHWSPGMELVALGAIESRTTDLPPAMDTPPYPFSADRGGADGRAPEWFLTYAAPGSDRVVARVAGPEDITFHAERDPSAGDEPLPEWQVDSVEAVRAARSDAALAALADRKDAAVSSVLLGLGAAGAAWIIAAETPQGERAEAFVDAATGQVRELGDIFAAANPSTVQRFEYEGTYRQGDGPPAHDYEQQGEGYDVYANLTYGASGWPAGARLDVTLWFDGLDISWEERAHEPGETRYRWLDIGAGAYRVTVHGDEEAPPAGATATYTLTVDIVPRA